MRTDTYGAIADATGLGKGLALRHPLGYIRDYCQRRGLPLLNLLAVRGWDDSMRPGEAGGVDDEPIAENAWRAQVIAVYAYDWSGETLPDTLWTHLAPRPR